MSASLANAPADIARLCDLFLHEDTDAQGRAFLYPDESEGDSPDCDEMSARFLDVARREGYTGYIVHAISVDEGPHWCAVVSSPDGDRDIAVDWTAPQFFNAGFPEPPVDPASIPCPLIFDWPGEYPLAAVAIESHRVVPAA